jgi:hypothetical protein
MAFPQAISTELRGYPLRWFFVAKRQIAQPFTDWLISCLRPIKDRFQWSGRGLGHRRNVPIMVRKSILIHPKKSNGLVSKRRKRRGGFGMDGGGDH